MQAKAYSKSTLVSLEPLMQSRFLESVIVWFAKEIILFRLFGLYPRFRYILSIVYWINVWFSTKILIESEVCSNIWPIIGGG